MKIIPRTIASILLFLLLNIITFKATATPIQQFKIEGNKSLSEAEIQSVLQPFINLSLSLDNITNAKLALIDYYQKLGYLNTIVTVPPQKLNDGSVTLKITEGKIESIEIYGNRKLSTEWIASQIKQDSFNAIYLEESLRLLRKSPNIEDISARLTSGSQGSQVKLEIQIQEKIPNYWLYESNNYSSRASGSWENSLSYINPNVGGKEELLAWRAGIVRGGHTLLGTYNFPLDNKGQKLGVTFNSSRKRVTEEPIASILDLQSASNALSIDWEYPLIRKYNRETQLSLQLRYQNSVTKLDGQNFPFSTASNNGKTDIVEATLGISTNSQSARSAWSARSELSLGTGTFGRDFVTWNNYAAFWQKVGHNIAKLQLETQLASADLFPEKQFSLGGIDRGRGYRNDLYLADSGIFASAQLQIPIIGDRLSLIPFVEGGTVWGRESSGSVLSVGSSLNWQLTPSLAIKGDFGLPLTETEFKEHWLFSLRYGF